MQDALLDVRPSRFVPGALDLDEHVRSVASRWFNVWLKNRLPGCTPSTCRNDNKAYAK